MTGGSVPTCSLGQFERARDIVERGVSPAIAAAKGRPCFSVLSPGKGRAATDQEAAIRLGYKIGTYPTGMLSPAIAGMQAGLAANAAGKQEAPGALPLSTLRAVLGYDAYDAEAKPYRLPD